MMTVKRAMQLFAFGACAVAVAPAALAKAEPGFYLGVSLGQSTYDIDKGDLDEGIRDGLASSGAILSHSSTLEDGDTSLALIAGYRFLPYVSLELSYLDLGTAEYQSTTTINPFGPITLATATANLESQTKGLTIAGIGSIPIGNVFDLHGRLGVFINHTEMTVTAVATAQGVTATDTETETFDSAGPLFGVGAAFHLGGHFTLSLDWTRYANLADENEDDDFETTDGFDADSLSLTALYKF